MLLPDRTFTLVENHSLNAGGLSLGDTIAFLDDNLTYNGWNLRRGSLDDALKQPQSFIAIVDRGHAVLVDDEVELDRHCYLKVRDPAVGGYLERRDWFEDQRLVRDDNLISHPTFRPELVP